MLMIPACDSLCCILVRPFVSAVALNLVDFKVPVSTDAYLLLLDLLCHEFPRVRKATAEDLYVKLLTLDDAFDEDKVRSVLSRCPIASIPSVGRMRGLL